MGILLIVALGALGAWILSRSVVRPVRRLAEASGRLAEGEVGVTVAPDRPARAARACRVVQRHERQVDEGSGGRAVVPAVGQPRAQDAAHLDPRLCRGTRRRGAAGRRGGRRDRRRVGPARAPRGRPARLGAHAQERLHGAQRDGRSGGGRRRGRAPLRGDGARRRPDAACSSSRRRASPTADHGRVLQVVSNLVENAVRCTPSPGSVTISTRARPGLRGRHRPRPDERRSAARLRTFLSLQPLRSRSSRSAPVWVSPSSRS